jgi:hypothetical protein
MLAGVLLHVIETPRPIDGPANRPRRQIAVDYVEDRSAVPIDDVDDPRISERADVERLTT